MNKRFAMLRLPCSALRILKRLQHNLSRTSFLGTVGTLGTIETNRLKSIWYTEAGMGDRLRP
ncbi:MAG: hypothetical protein LBH59_08585 [Planctomycetaceae bacterium]|nr:hypothetical protein [Planctomycetaceae bacterium]